MLVSVHRLTSVKSLKGTLTIEVLVFYSSSSASKQEKKKYFYGQMTFTGKCHHGLTRLQVWMDGQLSPASVPVERPLGGEWL